MRADKDKNKTAIPATNKPPSSNNP